MLTNIMVDLFKKLQEAKVQQEHVLEENTQVLIKESPSGQDAQKSTQIGAQKTEQTLEQMSKKVSTEAVEQLAFRLRKVVKTKVNTEVPMAWKDKIDDLAHELGIGKYELVMYIIGAFLGEIEAPTHT